MFTKLSKTLKKEKNLPLLRTLQKVFQSGKKDVIRLLIFKKLQKTFQFFEQFAKSVSICLRRCEKGFNFFDKMRKVFHFF